MIQIYYENKIFYIQKQFEIISKHIPLCNTNDCLFLKYLKKNIETEPNQYTIYYGFNTIYTNIHDIIKQYGNTRSFNIIDLEDNYSRMVADINDPSYNIHSFSKQILFPEGYDFEVRVNGKLKQNKLYYYTNEYIKNYEIYESIISDIIETPFIQAKENSIHGYMYEFDTIDNFLMFILKHQS